MAGFPSAHVELDRDTLGIVLAGVFAGLAVLLAVVALTKQPFLLLVALPFAAAAYLVWIGATGRTPLVGRTRRVSPEEARRARARRGERESEGARSRFSREAREAREASGERASTGRQRAQARSDTLARREAARVLGVDVDADPAKVRAAYRESVKEVHPDAEDGDTDAFQRVNAAYERLSEE